VVIQANKNSPLFLVTSAEIEKYRYCVLTAVPIELQINIAKREHAISTPISEANTFKHLTHKTLIIRVLYKTFVVTGCTV
jgi:hypothetical protein